MRESYPWRVITWAAPANIAGDSDVATSGTPVYAYDWANNAEVVNGVTFTGTTASSVGTNLNIAFSTGQFSDNTSAFTSSSTPFSALSSTYKSILVGAALANSANQLFTVTLSNLVVGNDYLVQMWVSHPRNGSATYTRSETNNGGGNIVILHYDANQTGGSPGRSTIGTFTADGTTQSFSLESSNSASSSTQINALQLRLTGQSPAATITYVGTQFDLGPGWRTSSTNKSLDIDGNDVWAAMATTWSTLLRCSPFIWPPARY